jgi:hypothetical protein
VRNSGITISGTGVEMASAQRIAPRGKGRVAARRGAVNEIAWSILMKRRVPAHLLMGAFDGEEQPAIGRRHQLALLKGLGRVLCRRGKYAVTILRNADGEDLAMLAVEDREDALRVSRTLCGRSAAPFGPWLSHRSFSIGASTYRRIAIALVEG